MDTATGRSKENSVEMVEKRFRINGTPKKDSITILTKVQIIRDCEAGMSRQQIRQKYNLKSVNNVSRIMLNKSKFLEAFETHELSPGRRTLKLSSDMRSKCSILD